MKVAIVIDTFPKLSESFILNQIVSLIDKKIEVRIFARRRDVSEPVNELFTKYNLERVTYYEPDQPATAWLRKSRNLGLFFLLILRSPLTFLRLVYFQKCFFKRVYLYAIWPLLDQPSDFDLVHAHFGPSGVKACNLQMLGYLKAPLICSFHGYDVDRNDFRSDPSFYSGLFRDAILITGNSSFTVRNIHRLGCPLEKLRCLPESLFTDYFKPDRTLRSKEDVVRILTVARLVEFKGVEYSLRSIAELVERGINNIKYTVIGDGPLKGDLTDLTGELGIDQYVSFLGPRTQDFIIKTMNESDIFLLTGITSVDGREENQGLVLQEAQAMELPVVASDTGGISEGVLNGKTGFLVAQKDVEGFADRLSCLISDPDLRKRFGQEGRRFVRENFDSTVLGEKLMGLYRQIAA